MINAFKGFYCEIDSSKESSIIKTEIGRMLKVAFMPKYTKRPPRILIAGPPGSGKSTIGELLARRYNLIFVSAASLLEGKISTKAIQGQVATSLADKGEPVPDMIMGKLVEERLNQPDCKVNGWVLEGFPINEAQIKILKQGKHVVSLTVELELEDDIAYERNESRRIDPVTGKVYNLLVDQLKPHSEVIKRLVTRDCDTHEAVGMRLKQWKEHKGKLIDAYRKTHVAISAEKPIQAVLEAISDAIEN